MQWEKHSVAIFFEILSFEPETRKVLFGHKVRVDGSFVVGKGIDLVSVSFNLGNFCSSHESLQQKVKKMNWKQSLGTVTSVPSTTSLTAQLENFAFSL